MGSDKKIKILVVDDDEMVRETFSDVFRSDGFEVKEAIDGVDGLEKAMEFIPDVILTGIIMPKMDGFALKDALSKNVATVNAPIIMLSHMGREEDRKKAMESGIRDFIVVGMITPKELKEKISDLLQSGEEYKIKFNASELDAPKLEKDLGFNSGFKCPKCQGETILFLKKINHGTQNLSAKFICPNCDKK